TLLKLREREEEWLGPARNSERFSTTILYALLMPMAPLSTANAVISQVRTTVWTSLLSEPKAKLISTPATKERCGHIMDRNSIITTGRAISTLTSRNTMNSSTL